MTKLLVSITMRSLLQPPPRRCRFSPQRLLGAELARHFFRFMGCLYVIVISVCVARSLACSVIHCPECLFALGIPTLMYPYPK
jgi:hypothetical protein